MTNDDRIRARRGRGALSNRSGRFEATSRLAFDDGWGSLDEPEPPALETILTAETSRSILSTNDSPDIPFEQSINPYKGCEHGCVYCFARPSHAYLGLSPGADFESRIVYKPEAASLLRATLARASYRCRVIALGANTDPYQPAERRLGISRSILEVLAEARHPVSIVTKSALILRDLDLLSAMAESGTANVLISITSLEPRLARRMEPRAAAPHRRLSTVRALRDAGVPVGVLVSPMIPALNDHELEAILEAAREADALAARYLLVRLPHELKELFREWLEHHVPDRAPRVLSLIRDTRGGALYDPRFGVRQRGTGVYADLLARRFAVAARRTGLDGDLPGLDTRQFRRPDPAGQLSLDLP